MKKRIYVVSLLVFLVTVVVWASGGFHTGWTQTQIPVEGVDEITGIEYTTMEEGFVPGIEFPLAGLVGGLLISAISWGVTRFNARSST